LRFARFALSQTLLQSLVGVVAAGMVEGVGMAEVVVGTAEVVDTAGAVVFMDLLSTVAVVMAGVAMH